MNKQSEAAALQVYVTYFDSYIRGDVKTIELLLDNEYTQIGSAETEVFFNNVSFMSPNEVRFDTEANRCTSRGY